MDPLSASLLKLSTANNTSDYPLTYSSSTRQHVAANAASSTAATVDSLSQVPSEHGSSSANSEGMAADEATDVLSPLGSPRTVSSPIPVTANGFSSRGGSGGGSSHTHFHPDINYPRPGLSSSPHNITSRSGGSAPTGNSTRSSYDSDHPIAARAYRPSSASMPPPSPPDPDLDPEVLGQLLQKHASPALTETRFSLDDFLKNKARLATAARRELGGGQSTADDDDVGSCLEGSGHDAELARQAAHLSSVVEGVAEESKVNRELAALLLERFDNSRKALECLLKLLTCLMEAEQAYSTAMAAAAKAAAAGPLAAPADSGGLSAAVEGLVQLPAAAAAGHRQLYLELQLLVDSVRGLWRLYTAAAKDLKQAISTVQRSVDSCCKQLTLSFTEHKAACEAFDAAVVYHSAANNTGSAGSAVRHHRAHSSSSVEAVGDAWTGAAGVAAAALHLAAGSGAGGGVLRPRFAAAPSRDPWASEGKLVIEQQALQKWQDQERDLLQRGFDSLQSLEQERTAALLRAGDTLAAAYCSAVAGLPAAAQGLRDMLSGLHGSGEAGVQHLAQVAQDMCATNQKLAARQADTVSSVSQELFCSPEIIRQGPLELWRPKTSSWEELHFVLTRAGFLHWFRSMEEVTPQEPPLNLCRCSFEAGQAPVFHLVESGSGGWLVGRGTRKITVKASSIDECCEWAIALREAISLSSSTGAAAGSTSGSRHHSRLSR